MNHVDETNDTAADATGTAEHSVEPRKSGRRGIIAFLLVAVVGIGVAIPLLKADRLEDVTQESLDAAVDKWENVRSTINGYSATINVEGRMPGEYKITVASGNVESVTFNDSPLTLERTSGVWTVEGMQEMVDLDLRRKQQLAESGNHTFVTRALFDPAYGYPKKYLRFDYGTKQTVTWTVTEFVTSGL